jgi:proline dehydrogenase
MSTATAIQDLPARTMRSVLVGLSHRRMLGRVAVRTPLTRAMVARFVVGETLEAALDALERLSASGFRTTVDVLGESVTSGDAASAAAGRYVETLDALAARGLDRNVSLKLTQMGLDLGRQACTANLERILSRAESLDAFVRIDMEDSCRTDATLDIWREAHARHPKTGIVIQSALRRSAADVEGIIEAGGRVRLCKGAYAEPASVAFQARDEVDASYVAIMERLLVASDYPALATHDPRMINHAIRFARREGIGPERFEFQMLHGVRRDLQERLVRAGYTIRVYVPYGTEWYPYFMRRLAERPANVAFILRSLVQEGTAER